MKNLETKQTEKKEQYILRASYKTAVLPKANTDNIVIENVRHLNF